MWLTAQRVAIVSCALALAVAGGCGKAKPAGDAGTGGRGGTGGAGGTNCCAMASPTCDCFQVGGTRGPGGACPSLCDGRPNDFVQDVDENGCPYLRLAHGLSCLSPPPNDAGADAGDAADAPTDGQSTDAAKDVPTSDVADSAVDQSGIDQSGVDQSGDTSGDGAAGALRALCVNTGGTVGSSMCCQTAGDFPSSCTTGACGCAPASSHAVATCTCPSGTCFSTVNGCAIRACSQMLDQSCNDNPIISSIHGTCQADGTCTCKPSYSIVPATGKCN